MRDLNFLDSWIGKGAKAKGGSQNQWTVQISPMVGLVRLLLHTDDHYCSISGWYFCGEFFFSKFLCPRNPFKQFKYSSYHSGIPLAQSSSTAIQSLYGCFSFASTSH
jgi:hypothetical protein